MSTREEQIVKESKTRSNIHINRIDGYKDESWDNGYTQGYENGFIIGALWADNNPRTDIIQRDSISFCRMLLVEKFCNIAKKHTNKIIEEVPEMKDAYDMIDMFDKACESIGYKLNDNGIYE